MSHHEKIAWGSLFASLLAWSFLTMRMTDSGAVVNVLIIHALLTVLFLGHIISQAATIWLYRA